MTDFTNLAALVAQGQSLLDLVKGGHITQLEADSAAKLGEVDAALAAKIAQANTDIANATAPISDKIPRIQLSKNQKLLISSGTVPDDFTFAAQVTSELVGYVSPSATRDPTSLALLTEIETDILEQFSGFNIRKDGPYSSGFNVVRLSWDFTGDFSGEKALFHIGNGKITSKSELTFASFMKLESGGVFNTVSEGAELGKWRFCRETRAGVSDNSFASYHSVTVFVTSVTGSLVMALPVISTGTVDQPQHIFQLFQI
jgi:hypothetical protein